MLCILTYINPWSSAEIPINLLLELQVSLSSTVLTTISNINLLLELQLFIALVGSVQGLWLLCPSQSSCNRCRKFAMSGLSWMSKSGEIIPYIEVLLVVMHVHMADCCHMLSSVTDSSGKW